jgi:hypothetical protein
MIQRKIQKHPLILIDLEEAKKKEDAGTYQRRGIPKQVRFVKPPQTRSALTTILETQKNMVDPRATTAGVQELDKAIKTPGAYEIRFYK